MYILQSVQSDNVKYMPLGFNSTQNKNCIVSDRDSSPKVRYHIHLRPEIVLMNIKTPRILYHLHEFVTKRFSEKQPKSMDFFNGNSCYF